MNHDPSRAEALFLASVEITGAQERADFLDRECGNDHALRERVEALLVSHAEAGDFLQPDAPNTAMEAEFARLKPEEAGERIDNYKLLQQIGEGGFGVVWMAEQERPVRRRVALKIIKMGMDTKEVIARFEQERQALAMMDHPSIAKVFDAGATPFGRPYFVMELVRGIKITDYCDQASLPTADRLQIFISVCQAVQHAHQKGIIHRDLKPSNILITLHDGVPVPKIIDFGVAKAIQQQRLTDLTLFTQFEQMIGTPLYMSPEQAELSGLDIDTRSDIYSLGVLLYELLTGRTPFDPEELMNQGLDEIRRAIREQEPQTPSMFLKTMAAVTRNVIAQHRQSDPVELTNLLRGDLDWIVMKALEKDRGRRYATAVEFAKDVERHLSDEPVLARPPSDSYRFCRLVKRNRLAFSAAAAVALSLMVGAGVSTWLFVRERKARGTAQDEWARAEQEARRANYESVAAQAARARAEQEAGRANRESAAARASALRARHLTYAAHIQAAQFLLNAQQYTEATKILQQDVPNPGEADLRGIEWRYLWRCIYGNSSDAAARVTRAADGKAITSPTECALTAQESLLGFSRDSESFWTLTESGEAHRWTVADGRLARTSKIPDLRSKQFVLSLGDEVLSGSSNGELKLIRLEDGQTTLVGQVNVPGAVLVKISADRRFGALVSERKTLLIWDFQAGKVVNSFEGFAGSGTDMAEKIAFSSHAELFACAGPSNLAVGEISPLSIRLKIGNSSPEITAVAFSPDRRFLATGTVEGAVNLLALPRFTDNAINFHGTTKPLIFSGHAGRVENVQFTPDGCTLVTSGTDGLRFWSVETGQELITFAPFARILFSPDGNVMALYRAGGSPKRVRVIRMPTTKKIDEADWKVPPPVRTPPVEAKLTG